MTVRRTIDTALDSLRHDERTPTDDEVIHEARAWLARTEILLDWIAKHPKFVEIKSEAAVLLMRYRGTSE
jgi:hypothetical protein